MLFIILMIFIGGAFILQIFLGYFQVKHLSGLFVRMRRKGKVAIGKKKGHFKSGTIVFLAVDSKGNILEAKKMQGVTILARFRTLKELAGENIMNINAFKVGQYNKLLKLAIDDAVKNYRTVVQGGTVEEAAGTPLSTAWIGIRSLFMNRGRSNNQKG